MVKKGQSISINTIIILIIALVVLVIVVLFFSGTFSKGAVGINNVLNPAINQTNQTGHLFNNLSSQASS
jgi:flagellar basal body-associated protein FliL